jgi:hypothetical protein
MVSTPEIGDIIRIRSWHGVVLDVLAGSSGRTVLRVQTVRNLFRRLNPEFIEFDLAPDVISPATLDDLQQEIAQYQAFLNESVQQLLGSASTNGHLHASS